MPRADAWTVAEFEQLLRSHTLSDVELATRNGRRTRGAIEAMRAAVHKYHDVGNDGSFRLTDEQAAIIDRHRGELTCHSCSARY